MESPSIASNKRKFRNENFTISNRTPTTHLDLPIDHAIHLNRLRVGLLLNNHRFSHNFLDTPSPSCPCGARSQNEKHFLLECTLLQFHRNRLHRSLTDLNLIDHFNDLNKKNKINFLLYGAPDLTVVTNDSIISASSRFIFDSKHVINS